jgi:hypothetical protein
MSTTQVHSSPELGKALRDAHRCGSQAGVLKPPQQLTPLRDIQSAQPFPLPRPLPPPTNPWGNYVTADQVVQTCPTEAEMHQIRADFNIYFDKGLVDNGIVVPWTCSNQGSESSIMLSMYNIFRLAKYIPFSSTFPWDSQYNNLYQWLKDLGLITIGFFWAQPGELSHGWDKKIYLVGNDLAERTTEM